MSDLTELLDRLTHRYVSGGLHVAPETRLMLYTLAVALRAEDILELGYDAGLTLEILAATGARRVVGVDNLTEYNFVESDAQKRLEPYDNVELFHGEAIEYLTALSNESVDFVHVDDSHEREHVYFEALQIKRVLRPGGMAVFHNDGTPHLWLVMSAFDDWGWMRFPAVSPHSGKPFDLGVVRKPMEGWL